MAQDRLRANGGEAAVAYGRGARTPGAKASTNDNLINYFYLYTIVCFYGIVIILNRRTIPVD